MIIYVGSLWFKKKKMKQGRMNSMIVNTHVIIQISKSVKKLGGGHLGV